MSLFGSTLIRNIRHIQIKKVAYHPNLFKAVITFEKTNRHYKENDEIEYLNNVLEDIKLKDLKEVVKARCE